LTIKSTSHTTLVYATFFALTYLCFVMPVNIQLSKIEESCQLSAFSPQLTPSRRPAAQS
jgi:hypothetical protein